LTIDTIDSTFKISSNVILDPNFIGIGIPETDFWSILTEMNKKNLECDLSDQARSLRCNSSKILEVENIAFKISDEQVSLPLSLLRQSKGNYFNIQFYCISSTNPNCIFVNQQYSTRWILGNKFHTYFYSVYTYSSSADSGTLSLYLAKQSVQRPLNDVNPHTFVSGSLDVLFQIIISVGSFMVLVGIVFGVRAIWKKWMTKKRPIYDSKWEERQKEKGDDKSEKDSENQSIDDDEPADIELKPRDDDDDDGL
jgi:hypothetical protein